MSLKGDRAVYITDIAYITEQASDPGAVLVLKASQPSGRAVGQGINDSAAVAVPVGTGSPASGTKVLGIALDAVVDIDQTRVHRNFQKTEQVVGENVCLLKDGWVWTDMVAGTPAAGDDAYLGASSKLQNSQVNGIPAVGKFLTAKDADGFAKVSIKVA